MRRRGFRLQGRADSFAFAAPSATRSLVEAAGLTPEEAEQVIGVSLEVMGKANALLWCRYADQICEAGRARKLAAPAA